ncbi:HAD family hydrolase [Gloeocapsopsis dulcis]|uniref:L-2-haloalkanoic acid dehalogenase n=1 Tax=Gloeocapsopsis dulcis AAB1 = 1H9 TaxID=1433147 RepID=A0A6N8FW08_9CHRO|nr:HAD family hydrolase [Gloeocapsopsis dulcis]MUL37253.1 L-2-haloalkanoic acid dehalogenase [Gloeocapsopsis dulcis AAB1 = 1H9]WNN91061.1 HAD family hydrolase [Gloeocapsopsis dulcis]
MVKAVLFDLDGTLLDRDASIEQFITTQYDRLTAHLSHILKIDYVTRFIELDNRGHVWKDKVYQTLVAEFEIEGMSWQTLLEDYETQFQLHCVPFDFLVEMLKMLKQQGYLLGIVTNGLGQFQTRSIEGLGIRDYFDVILISELEQVRKPQAEIFQRAMTRLDVSASDSVFVGDHPEADIMGAKRAKMRAIWKRSLHWLEVNEADAIINELSEIPLILEQFRGN